MFMLEKVEKVEELKRFKELKMLQALPSEADAKDGCKLKTRWIPSWESLLRFGWGLGEGL